MSNDNKRLFLAFEVKAHWPFHLPAGRIIPEEGRHMTLAFLGNTSFKPLKEKLQNLPPPPFLPNQEGVCDRVLFLPTQAPKVVAWHVRLFDYSDCLIDYHNTICDYLINEGYKIERRDFLPHISVARSPFISSDWKQAFEPLPVRLMELKLYESVGNLNYKPIWSFPYNCSGVPS
jgi:2'-5' RNA ligase